MALPADLGGIGGVDGPYLRTGKRKEDAPRRPLSCYPEEENPGKDRQDSEGVPRSSAQPPNGNSGNHPVTSSGV